MLHRICRRSLIFSLSFFAASSLILVTAHGEPQRSNPQRAIDANASGHRAIDRQPFRDAWWNEQDPVAHGSPGGLFVGGLLHETMGIATLMGEDTTGNGAFDRLHITVPNTPDNDPTVPDGARLVLSNAPATTTEGLLISGWKTTLGRSGGGAGGGGRIAVTGFANPAYIQLGIGDIQGECPNPDHKEWIDVSSVSTGVGPPVGGTVRVRGTHKGEAVIEDFILLPPGGKVGIGCGPNIGEISDGKGIELESIWKVSDDPHIPGVIIIEHELCWPEPTQFELENWINPGGELITLDKLEIEVELELDPGELHLAARVFEIALIDTNIMIDPARIRTRPVDAPASTEDSSMKSLGHARLIGVEVCEENPDPRKPPLCSHAIELSNLGNSGNDGVAARTGRNPQTGKEIKIAAKKLPAGDTLVCGMTEHFATDGGGGSDGEPITKTTLRSLGDSLFASADFSKIASSASVCARGGDGTLWCWGANNSPSTIVSPGGAPIEVVSVIESPHAGGAHVPGFVWNFASPVLIPAPEGEAIESSELRFISGQPHIVENENGLVLSYATAPGSPAGSLILTDFADAHVGFTHGHVFGFEHQALDGATMAILDKLPSEVQLMLPDDLPLVDGAPPVLVSAAADGGGGGGGRVAVSAAPDGGGVDFFNMTILPVDLDEPGDGVSGKVEAVADDCPGCDLSYGWTIARAAEDGGGGDLGYEVSVDFSGLAVDVQDISFYNNGELVAHVSGALNGTVVRAAVPPPMLEHVGGVLDESGLQIGGPYMGFGWFEPVMVAIDGGDAVEADEVRAGTGNVYEEVAVRPIRIEMGITSGGGAGGGRIIILDEAFGLFDLEHRASGAARIGCCVDADGDGWPELRLLNPSSGSPATVASNNLRAPRGNYQSDTRWSNIIDPCAGKPEPCEAFADGATLRNSLNIEVADASTGSDQFHVTTSVTDSKGVPGAADAVSADFTELGADTFTVQVLANDGVVAEIPNYTTNQAVFYEGWPCKWYTCDITGGGISKTLGWDRVNSFTFHGEGVAGGKQTHKGDSLRFTAQTDLELKWINHASLTTIDIPELHITDMTLGDVPQPTPCLGDLTGPDGEGPDGEVNGFDLLALLGCWGPAAQEGICNAADLSGPGGAPDGEINGFDLLALLGNWGPCN